MKHIEDDKCAVLHAEEFERIKSEKTIIKEALIDDREPVRGFVNSAGASEESAPGGMSLVDSHNPDWNDLDASEILQPTRSTSSQATAHLTTGLERLKLNNFPPLPAQQTPSTHDSAVAPPESNERDLLDLGEPEQRTSYKSQWDSIYGESIKDPPKAAWGDRNIRGHDSMISAATNENARPTPVNNPTASNPRVGSVISSTAPSILDPENYWNDHDQSYTCPISHCARNMKTVEDFRSHLLEAAHIGGKTQCPACLKKFNSVFALVSHCEMGSTKCQIRKMPNYDEVLRELTSGVLTTTGYLEDGSVRYKAVDADEW